MTAKGTIFFCEVVMIVTKESRDVVFECNDGLLGAVTLGSFIGGSIRSVVQGGLYILGLCNDARVEVFV